MVNNLERIVYGVPSAAAAARRESARAHAAGTRAPSLFRLGISSQTGDLYKFDLALCPFYKSLSSLCIFLVMCYPVEQLV